MDRMLSAPVILAIRTAVTVAFLAVFVLSLPLQATAPIKTEKGNFTVPGVAFMDGRDTEAVPPLTVSPINVWDNAPRSRVVCSLKHGTKVEVKEARYVASESRYYFKIVSGACTGWVPETFLSPTYKKAVGDIVS